ncbi:GTPase ObgE [Patescibacteria group bacterium]|nr:GTPase ObgE [Patescibacteria group bacterium]
MSKQLIDIAQIKIKAGDGGDGLVAFRREKGIAKGGPSGGDGGDGGSVYFRVNSNMATLADFRSHPVFKAGKGQAGKVKKMKGASGEDLYINVPVGTLIYEIRRNKEDKDNKEKEVLLGDMLDPGQVLLVAKGGEGGVGNWRFRSSTNRTPRQYTKGKTTREIELKLEIKLVADVGLVGLPNAGKSTLLNFLTNANAKVGEFPFTTLSPNLGVMTLNDKSKIILADIPGLIEGAYQGKGLGDQFLRHIERTRILVHVVDPLQGKDIYDVVNNSLENFETITNELKEHGRNLDKKPVISVVNKIDITEVRDRMVDIKKAFKKRDLNILGVSAFTGEGLDELSKRILSELSKVPKKPLFTVEKPVKVYTIDNLPNKRMVFDDNAVLEKDIKRY